MNVRRWMIFSAIGVVAIFASLSCSTAEHAIGDAVGSASDEAGKTVGERVGNAVADQMLADLGPGRVHAYTMSLFQTFYYHGGYNLPVDSYEEGEFTRWKASGTGQGEVFERTLFKKKKDGSEWWRLESRQTTDDGNERVFISEVLLAPKKEGERNVLRMRVKYPDESEPSEVPVTKEESEKWAVSSEQELTEESLEGMRVGEESIETPAGSFQTTHYQGSHYAGAGELNWWTADEIPGDVVKYNRVVESDDGSSEEHYSFALVEHGTGATSSKLGVLDESTSKSSSGDDGGEAESDSSGGEEKTGGESGDDTFGK